MEKKGEQEIEEEEGKKCNIVMRFAVVRHMPWWRHVEIEGIERERERKREIGMDGIIDERARKL